MRKLLILITSIFISSSSYAETTAELIKQICQGEANCLACTDTSKNTLAKCVDKLTFNPLLENASNLDYIIFGGLSKTTTEKVCGNTQTKEMCRPISTKNTELYEKVMYIDVTPRYNSNNGFSETRIWCDKTNCYQRIYVIGDGFWECDNRNDKDCKVKEDRTFTVPNISYTTTDDVTTFLVDVNNNGNYTTFQYGESIYFKQYDSQNIYPHNFNIKMKVNTLIERLSYVCGENKPYPCVSENNGASYYCTPTPCFTINPDNSLTEADKKPADLTPEYIAPDNGSCGIDMDLFLFTPIGGKHKECRQKAVHIAGNDLTSPNQCVKQENLSNEAKESLLGGLNKTFDKIKKVLDPGSELLGDLSMLVNPAAFVLKAYELIGEAIIRNLAEEATQEEKDLSLLRASYGEDGACHKIGEYCSSYNMDGMYGESLSGVKWDLTSCGRRSSLYCCYDSPIAKAFNRAAREQLPGFTWGENLEASNIQSNYKQPRPDCRGLTIEELSKININDPEFAKEMKAYVNNVIMPELTGPGGMLDISRLQETSKKMADDIQNYYK